MLRPSSDGVLSMSRTNREMWDSQNYVRESFDSNTILIHLGYIDTAKLVDEMMIDDCLIGLL